MDTQLQDGPAAEGLGDESLNTSSASNPPQDTNHHDHKKGGIHSNALFAARMGRSPVAHVDHHNTSTLSETGTNVSYESPHSTGYGNVIGTGPTAGSSSTAATNQPDQNPTESNPEQP